MAARLSLDKSSALLRLAEKVSDLDKANARLVHVASHDPITGLPNRLLLSEQVEQALARVERGEMIAVHLIDLDRFKEVNDTLGHPAGDRLLQMAATRLRALVRGSDTIARMGGDEFAIVQVALADASDASAMADRVIAHLSGPYDIDGHQVLVGASIGVAVACGERLTPDQLIRNADLALYSAKDDGGGVFHFFKTEMGAYMQERRELEQSLRKALTADEFELWYQPIVDVASNRIMAFEALIRWRDPRLGLIPPHAFIPLAEEIGLIVPIGAWAIRQACITAARWPDNIRVAVNLSPIQFRNPDLVSEVSTALLCSGLTPDRLELEITEAALLENSEATIAVLYQLRELGVRLAMDDFGTGYSSLNYLQSFPFDRIKIDRSFVSDIARSTASLNIVRAVVALARGLGMAVTAEGVETHEQRRAVAAEGCAEMQGFLFSKPVPHHAIGSFLVAEHRWLNPRQTAA
jgi:diguanylate cyclase (GGDEF)-like protein